MSNQNTPEENNETNESGTPEVSIRLDQFLQLCGVPTGGQAKLLIQGGQVSLNGEIETRRRKKLLPGDIVQIDSETFEVELSSEE